MEILYFTQYLSPLGGGGEVLFFILAKRISEMGHGVHVICHDFPTKKISIPNLKIHKVKPILSEEPGSFPSFKQHLTYMLNSLTKGIDVIRKNSIDLIHANVLSPVPPAELLGKICRIPVVITVHDVYSASLTDYWKIWSLQENTSSLYSFIGPLYEKMILKLPVSTIHVVSNATKNDILSINRQARISLIYNGIDFGGLCSTPQIRFERFVLFIGRLIITKNLEVVIRAFSHVVSRIPDAKLVIVGEGPMRNQWEKLSKSLKLLNNIEFRGFITEIDKTSLLAKCSALVFPSLVEGFGLVILESFAMSKPVVVPDAPPFNEIVDNEVDGLLVSQNNPSSWSEKIIRVFSDNEFSAKMGANGRRKVETRFNSHIMAREMEHLYMQLTSKGK